MLIVQPDQDEFLPQYGRSLADPRVERPPVGLDNEHGGDGRVSECSDLKHTGNANLPLPRLEPERSGDGAANGVQVRGVQDEFLFRNRNGVATPRIALAHGCNASVVRVPHHAVGAAASAGAWIRGGRVGQAPEKCLT
jgi:hypothetical protein